MHEPAVLDSAGFLCDALHLFLDKLDSAFGPLLDLVFRRVVGPAWGDGLSAEFVLGTNQGRECVEEGAQGMDSVVISKFVSDRGLSRLDTDIMAG